MVPARHKPSPMCQPNNRTPRVREPQAPTRPLTQGNMHALTEAQRGLMDLLCAGYTQKEAAHQRRISHGSAKVYVANAKEVSGCRTTISMAVQYAQWRDANR